MEVLFIENTNRRVYSELLKNLTNDYLLVQDNYSRGVYTVHKMLVNYKPMGKSTGTTSDGIKFMANGRPRFHKDK